MLILFIICYASISHNSIGKRYQNPIPVAWIVKETEGEIGYDGQEPLLRAVYKLIPEGIKVMLTADRFYGTAALITLCQSFGWQYRIRLKGNLTEKIKEIEKYLKIQGESEKDIHQIYTSVPGIGLVHARQLVNELGDMSQFRNEKQLFSYTGLTPSEYSSGERQGRAVLRKILVEASWVAIA